MSAAGRFGRRRRREGDGAAIATVGTVVIHALVGGVLFGLPQGPALPTLPVYAVRLVAAPRVEPDQRRAPEAVQRQAEQPPQITETPPPRNTAAEEAPPPPPDPEAAREPAPRTTPEEVLDPDVEPSTGTDPETVDIPGVEFPFPGYLNNIVAQVYRRWQRPRGNVSLRAEVLFFIRRDGSITNFQFLQRSGNLAFDLNAQGAVEAAGNARAFGPLPERYPDDVLPVSFFFDPATLRGPGGPSPSGFGFAEPR